MGTREKAATGGHGQVATGSSPKKPTALVANRTAVARAKKTEVANMNSENPLEDIERRCAHIRG